MTDHCRVHWHHPSKPITFCGTRGPYKDGLCWYHQRQTVYGCICDLDQPPPDINPDYEAARDAWEGEQRAKDENEQLRNDDFRDEAIRDVARGRRDG